METAERTPALTSHPRCSQQVLLEEINKKKALLSQKLTFKDKKSCFDRVMRLMGKRQAANKPVFWWVL